MGADQSITLIQEGRGADEFGIQPRPNGFGNWAENSSGSYSATLVPTSEEADLILNQLVSLLPVDRHTYTPAFLRASSLTGWRPIVCAVRRNGRPVGLVYLKEKTIGGLGTGLIYADAVLGNLTVAVQGHDQNVLHAALEKIISMPRSRGLRLCIRPGSYEQEVVRRLQGSFALDVSSHQVRYHSALELPATYELFLNSLGSRTRRNCRYYRRRFESAGGVYEEFSAFSDFCAAAESIVGRKVVGGTRRGLNRAFAMLSAVDKPVFAGLRTNQGTWLAVLGGWYTETNPIVFMQLNNDRDHAGSSLSLVLRSYFIEQLIRQGQRGLIFWSGSGGWTSRHDTPIPTLAVYLDKRDAAWRLGRQAAARLSGYLPDSLFPMIRWITPPLQ
jgi:hypothetical protein